MTHTEPLQGSYRRPRPAASPRAAYERPRPSYQQRAVDRAEHGQLDEAVVEVLVLARLKVEVNSHLSVNSALYAAAQDLVSAIYRRRELLAAAERACQEAARLLYGVEMAIAQRHYHSSIAIIDQALRRATRAPVAA